jgi:hypothetical protein
MLVVKKHKETTSILCSIYNKERDSTLILRRRMISDRFYSRLHLVVSTVSVLTSALGLSHHA